MMVCSKCGVPVVRDAAGWGHGPQSGPRVNVRHKVQPIEQPAPVHEAQDVEGKDVRIGSIVWFPEERPQRQKVVGIPEENMVLIVPADGSAPGEFADLPMYAWRGRRVKY